MIVKNLGDVPFTDTLGYEKLSKRIAIGPNDLSLIHI